MSTNDYVKIVLNFFELLAVVTGFYFYKKLQPTYWKDFVFLLLFIFLSEMIGKFLYYTPELKQYNGKWYRYIGTPIFLIGILYFLSRPIKNNWSWFGGILFFYVCGFVAEETFLSKSNAFFGSLSFQIVAVGILILCLKYLYYLLNTNKILLYKTDLHFWIALSSLVFVILSIPFFALRNSMAAKFPNFFNTYWKVTMVFNCIQYLLFTIGFVCNSRK